MSIIIVGLLILAAGFILANADANLRKFKTIFTAIGAIVIIIGASMACVVQIEPGQVGVQKLFGKVNDDILESGLNVINPLVKVVMFDIRTENWPRSNSRPYSII